MRAQDVAQHYEIRRKRITIEKKKGGCLCQFFLSCVNVRRRLVRDKRGETGISQRTRTNIAGEGGSRGIVLTEEHDNDWCTYIQYKGTDGEGTLVPFPLQPFSFPSQSFVHFVCSSVIS